MALLNTGCLFSTIQADVTGITTGYASDCFVVIAGAVDATTPDRCVTVPVSGCLASLYPTQTVTEGQVVFVEDIGVPVIAASGKWIGFDKRVLRRDAPIMGELFTWGYAVGGALGDGTTTSRSSPGSVAGGGTNWSIVSMGRCYGAGIKTDGTLWTWGANNNGQLGNGNTTARSSPGTTAGGGTTWCAVSAGVSHVLAIKTDGTLWTWGSNNSGELGIGTSFTPRSSPGTVAGGGTTWCFISAGTSSSAAIKTDGSLWTWGWNSCGRLGDSSTTDRSSPGTVDGGGNTWCKVSVKYNSSLALKTNGSLWSWGYNGFGQLGDETTTNRSSPGQVVPGSTNWVNISSGGYHSAGIKSDGTLWTWGAASFGRLGDGTSTNRSCPGTVAGGGSNWCGVSLDRYYSSSAIKTDGTVWTWGANNNGALGDGTTTNRSSPGTIVGGITTWFSVSMGSFGGGAIKM